MKERQFSRRRFTQGLALTSLVEPCIAGAIGPFKRSGASKLKLSLAAYSFRRQLTAKSGTPGAMDMLGFIDWCA